MSSAKKGRKPDAPTIPAEQLARMCARYETTIDGYFTIMGADHGDPELEKARDCAKAASELISMGRVADACHLVGLCQGVLLCKKLVTWEYLASEETRK